MTQEELLEEFDKLKSDASLEAAYKEYLRFILVFGCESSTESLYFDHLLSKTAVGKELL